MGGNFLPRMISRRLRRLGGPRVRVDKGQRTVRFTQFHPSRTVTKPLHRPAKLKLMTELISCWRLSNRNHPFKNTLSVITHQHYPLKNHASSDILRSPDFIMADAEEKARQEKIAAAKKRVCTPHPLIHQCDVLTLSCRSSK